MKNLLLTFIIAGLAMSACTSNPKSKTDEAVNNEAHQHEVAAPDTTLVTAAYICPMKCEGSASATPGKCPVCKMDLVAVEQTPAENAK